MTYRLIKRYCTMTFLALFLCLFQGAWADQSFSFVQICDTQLGFGKYKQDLARLEQSVRQINDDAPDFVLICGDLVNVTGNPRAIADFKSAIANFDIPCYYLPGNHDVGNEPDKSSLEQYRAQFGPDRLSFDYKGFTFVGVNTQLWKSPVPGETEEQDAWLLSTLEKAKAENRPVVVFGHYPLFSDEPNEEDGYNNLPLQKRKQLMDLYKASGVVAVLAGHVHRNVIREFSGIQHVVSATTSSNFGGEPYGYRLWHVDAQGNLRHEYVALPRPVPKTVGIDAEASDLPGGGFLALLGVCSCAVVLVVSLKARKRRKKGVKQCE